MFFGDKFYDMLRELKVWQRSLFALALSERMAPNYILFAEATDNKNQAEAFRHILDSMWEYHLKENSGIDLDDLLKPLMNHIPEADPDGPFGAFPARDAAMTLALAGTAFMKRTGEEAIEASGLSTATVAIYLEAKEGHEIEDDILRELPLMSSEMDFQVDLLSRVKIERSHPLINAIRQDIIKDGFSNIGIPRG